MIPRVIRAIVINRAALKSARNCDGDDDYCHRRDYCDDHVDHGDHGDHDDHCDAIIVYANGENDGVMSFLVQSAIDSNRTLNVVLHIQSFRRSSLISNVEGIQSVGIAELLGFNRRMALMVRYSQGVAALWVSWLRL